MQKSTIPVKAAMNSNESPLKTKWHKIIPTRDSAAQANACLIGENRLAIPGMIMD
jgi:hypothetical protein